MWRALFFAVGIMLVIVGVECLLIDSATLAADKTEVMPVRQGWFDTQQVIEAPTGRVVKPADWHPWSLLASGAIVLLYSFTLPARWGAKAG